MLHLTHNTAQDRPGARSTELATSFLSRIQARGAGSLDRFQSRRHRYRDRRFARFRDHSHPPQSRAELAEARLERSPCTMDGPRRPAIGWLQLCFAAIGPYAIAGSSISWRSSSLPHFPRAVEGVLAMMYPDRVKSYPPSSVLPKTARPRRFHLLAYSLLSRFQNGLVYDDLRAQQKACMPLTCRCEAPPEVFDLRPSNDSSLLDPSIRIGNRSRWLTKATVQ